MKDIITSIIGTLGFCSILNVPKNKIFWVGIGATISSITFTILNVNIGLNIFTSTLIASLSIGIYSEIMARILKTPSTIILLPSTVPLLPGGSLYYTMNYLVSGEWGKFKFYSIETISTGGGIAVGAIVTAILLKLITHKQRI
jgi:uncharacterized membrane protein YjjB (DUF3815 family)